MRAAFFTDTYHPSLDGVVRSVDHFRVGLRAQGHAVRVYAPAPDGPLPREAEVVWAPSIACPTYAQYRVPYRTTGLVADVRRTKPDLVHSHAMVVMGRAARSAAQSAHVPLVGTFHTLVPQAAHYLMPLAPFRPWTGRRLWDYFRGFYSSFDRVLAPSRLLVDRLREEGIAAQVLPNPVDTDLFTPGPQSGAKASPACASDHPARSSASARAGSRPAARPARASASPANPPHLLYIGRLAEEKNLDFLLDMVREPAWRSWGAVLDIAGSGPYRAPLEARVRREGLEASVRFLGPIPDADLPALYRSAACTLQPSLFETQGLTVIESMACGTPAVCRAGTAMAEAIRPGSSGEWFGSDPTQALEIVQKLCARRSRYARSARADALAYSIPACTQRLLAVYEDVLR